MLYNRVMREKGAVLIIILFALALILSTAGFVFYQTRIKPENKNVNEQNFASPSITPTPVAVIPKQKYENTFTSESLGIEFNYATYADPEKTQKIAVTEQEDRVVVHFAASPSSQGQFVQVFSKDPSDTLEDAIKKRFLSGIDSEDCFVNVSADPNNKDMIRASISYPWPDQNEPKFMFGEECPDEYKETNGIRYFLMDQNHASQFAFLSIGQYAIPADFSNNLMVGWQDTLKFIK